MQFTNYVLIEVLFTLRVVCSKLKSNEKLRMTKLKKQGHKNNLPILDSHAPTLSKFCLCKTNACKDYIILNVSIDSKKN